MIKHDLGGLLSMEEFTYAQQMFLLFKNAYSKQFLNMMPETYGEKMFMANFIPSENGKTKNIIDICQGPKENQHIFVRAKKSVSAHEIPRLYAI